MCAGGLYWAAFRIIRMPNSVLSASPISRLPTLSEIMKTADTLHIGCFFVRFTSTFLFHGIVNFTVLHFLQKFLAFSA
jgi:hypothetical protein